jgi:hypothetical protein
MTLTIIRGNGETLGAGGTAGASGGRVQNAIASASASTGVSFRYLYHQAGIESGFNPNAKASTSSASGLYQFTDQTWLGVIKQHGAEHGLSWAADAITRGANGHYYVADATTRQEILALRQSPETSAAMAGEYASDNQTILQSALGRDTNSTDLYMAHFLGPAGATRFLKAMSADPNASAASVMPAAAGSNRWVFYDKAGNPRSLSDVYQRFAARFDRSSAPAPSYNGGTSTGTDSSSDLARMQLAALNGTSEGTNVAELTPANLITPSPRTAKLAYMMLASMGV